MNANRTQRAALALGLAGAIVGMLLAAVVVIAGTVDGDAHPDGVGFGVSALVAAAAGAACTVLYARGIMPVAMALSMMLAAAWHVASSPLFGTPGGLLLLLGGLCGLFAREEVIARTRESHRAVPLIPGETE